MARSLAGTRIRQRRRSIGLTQKALAVMAEISPSYLNLIEHNRRPIGGKVMNALARALDIPARDLSEGPEMAIASTLEEVAAANSTELENPEDLLARFPAWSRKLAQLQESSINQARMIEALGDRLTHDPYLSESLHLMLSSITAIRATASLMTHAQDGEMDLAHSLRFNQNIHSESLRLSDAVQALVSYFDTASETQLSVATPGEEFDRFWQDIHPRLIELDARPKGDFADLLEGMAGPPRALAEHALLQYQNDAQKLPFDPFIKTASQLDFAPDRLANWAGCDLHTVFRRLSALPKMEGVPEFGLFEIDGSGHIHARRALPDFPLPRHTSACTLWPVYSSLQQPGQAITSKLSLPGGATFRCYACALTQGTPDFGTPMILRAAMLIRREQDAQGAVPAGTVCKLCPRAGCAARSEAQIMAAQRG